MNLALKGKTAFISGSTSGIGFGIAKKLLAEGVKVFINGRNQAKLNDAVCKLKENIPNAHVEGIAIDFEDTKSIQHLFETLDEVDILINNVGIYTAQSFFQTSDQDWYRQIEVNMMSGVRLSRFYLPKMLKKKWGRVLFISSECASLVPHDLVAYSTTKIALLSIAKGLAQLTKGTDVTVNAALPGSTMTEGAKEFLTNLVQKEHKTLANIEEDFFKKERPYSLLQRFANVEEISNSIAYFVSPLSSATNGATIRLDGGSIGSIF